MIPTGSWNATGTSTVSNSMAAGPMVFATLSIIAIIGLLLVITSIERYTLLFTAIEKIIHSVRYTLYGAGVLISTFALYSVCVFVVNLGTGSGFGIKEVGICIAAYALLTALGWGAAKVKERLMDMHSMYQIKKAYRNDTELSQK